MHVDIFSYPHFSYLVSYHVSFFLPFSPYLPSLSPNLCDSRLSSLLFCTPFYLQDFSHVCPSFDLQRVNSLELSMLEALKYLIKVSAGVFPCPCACFHTFVVWNVMSEMLCLKCEMWSLICEICITTNATCKICAASVFLFTFCGFLDWKFFYIPYIGISVAFIDRKSVV